MTSTPPLRPTETGSADVEPAAVLRGSSPVRSAAAIAAAAAVFLAVVVLAGVGRLDADVPGFLDKALGPEKAGAPLERTPARGVGVRIHDQGYTVSHRGASVSVVSEDVTRADWRRHVHGVSRETDFGTETIVVDGRKTEEFLTVVERQGERTWRWKLASRLQPRLTRDGAVSFLDPTRHLVTSISIDPVRILDVDGKDVTPEGLRWGLEEGDTGWWMTLELDDADLPLPYVIDPAVTHRASATQNNGAGSTSLTITKPAGAVEKDLLVALVSVRNNGTVTAPTGWTQVVNSAYSFYLRKSVWYKVAGASEPANYTWTFGTSGAAAGGISAFYGIKTSTAPGPLNVADTTPQTANSGTVTATSITTTTNNALVLAFFTARNNTTFTQAAGMTELYEVGASGGIDIATDSMIQVTAGATGNKTSTLGTSSRNSGTQASFNVDDVAPTGSLTDPGSPLAGTVTLNGSGSDTDSAVASVVFQRSPAGAGTWTDIGTDTTSPYSASFNTTGVSDGLYDLRVVVTDAAANVTSSSTVANRRVDNTAPASTTTFPASAGTYNTAGWNAGCGTIGFCGTYSDGGSGVSQVQISIRQGTGNYWSGGSFSSASEAWNTASIAAGSWSYAFAATSFPADGGYTVRVRATDAAGNVEAPNSRSFAVDRDEPETTIDSSPANPTASTSASFTFSSDEGGSTFECRLDGGSWGACSSPEGYSSLTDGSHTFEVRATDVAGNTDTSPASSTWLVDTTAPSSTTTFPAAGGEYNAGGWAAGCATAGLCGTYADGSGSGVSQVEVSIRQGSGNYWNGSSFSSASEVWNAAGLSAGSWSYPLAAGSFPADGSYTVRVRAVDAAANTEAPTSRGFEYDTTDPSAVFAFPAAGGAYTTSGWNAGCTVAGFCGSHSDSGTGVAGVGVSVRRVSTGLYWDGDSFDAAGEMFLSAALAGGDWSFGLAAPGFPADGAYTVHVRATDDAGNTEGGPSRTFTYDTTPPQTTIDSNPADPTGSTSADFVVSSSEGGSTFECRLDAGSWSACTSPKSYSGLSDGSHTFDVRATDIAGNTDGSPASFTWLVDTAAPSSTISFPAAAGTYNAAGWNAGCASSGLCGTYGDGSGSGVAEVEVSIRQGSGSYWDGSGFTSGSEVWNAASRSGGDWSLAFPASSFLADGSYTVRVRAVDSVGNAEAPSSRTFAFDATAPTGSLTAPADGAALRGVSVTVSSDSADAGSAVDSAEFQRRPAGGGTWTTIDTDTSSPYTVSWDTTPLTDGDYDLRVVTTDQAGNAVVSATRTVTVDNTAPSAATLDPLPGAIRNGQELTGSGADATSGVESLTYLYCAGTSCTPSTPVGSSTTGPDYNVIWTGQPADGDVRVLARVTDRAGNTLDSTIQDVLVDNTSPTGSLTAPANGATLGGVSVTVSSDSADAGSGVDSAEFQRRPAGGGTWTTIDTDTTSPSTVSWDTTPLTDGDYDLRVVTTDQAGNTFASATRTVTVDNTAPSVTITAPTGFVNAAAPDPFTVTATTPDGDVQTVELFSCSNASGGCSSGSWVSLGADPSAPYSASWPVDPDGNRALRAVSTDGAGNTGSDVVNVTVDRTSPSGALTAPADGAFVTATLTVSSDSADAGSGVDSAEFQRRPAGGGTWTTIDTDTTSPYSVSWDTTPLTDGDYDLRVVTTDQAGNTFASATRTVTVDNTTPSAPVVTLSESSPFAYASGTEIFVNTDETGSYDVEATSSDPHSGIDRIRFPGPTDDSSSPYSASYAFGDLSGPQAVTAFNGAGLTAATPFTVTPDTAEPAGGSVGYPDGYDTDGDVTITVDAGTDALSGVAPASAVLERRTSALSDGSCDPFAGGWNTVTSPDTVASGLCAQYRYRVSDRVGNEAIYTSANVVKVDLVNPGAPALALVESSPFAHVAGTEIFVNTNETGSYDVEASTSDAVSGIDKVVFPAGVEDTSAPYSAGYDFDDLLGTQTVTAHDRAGNTASSGFDVTEDVTAPSTTDDTASTGPSWQTAPVTVTLTPTDARAGVAATYYTTDGSVPTTSSDEGTSIDLTSDGVYTIRYFSVDNVGNVEPVRTAFTTIRIDQTSPSLPAITLDESSPYAHVSGSEIFVNTNQTGSFDVSATSSDAGSGIDMISFPGGVDDSTSPYSTTYDLDDLSGSQTVTAHDVAGNTASDTFTVTPDTAAPTGGFVDYPDGFDADGTVTVAVDAGSDALSGVNAASSVLERTTSALSGGTCAPFVGGWSAATSPDTVPDSTCARYRYRVFDRVGNEAIYTLPTSTVKVDLTVPQTTIDSAPADPSNDASPDFTFSSSEPASTFECRLDGGSWSACTSPEGLAGLGDGTHTFQVRATDAAGLTDPSPASYTWTVDTAAPNTSFDDVPPDPSNDDAPDFEFSAGEAGSTFECRLDGGAWTPCASPETIGLLADGGHTFQARATDAAGNVDASPASYTWTVDTVAPDTSFSVVPADPTNDTTPTFEFSANEAGSSFQCRLDVGPWGACSSPETVGALTDGSHTFEARATDQAGNQETAPASYTWVVDAGVPTVTITQPSGFVNASDADPYTLRATSPDGDVADVEFFRCSDDSAACSTGSWVSLGADASGPYEASWPLDPDGNRALRAVATDDASNTGADVVDATIDRTGNGRACRRSNKGVDAGRACCAG